MNQVLCIYVRVCAYTPSVCMYIRMYFYWRQNTIPGKGEVGVKWRAGEECMEDRVLGGKEEQQEERETGRRMRRGRGCGKSGSVLTGGAAGKHQVIATTPTVERGRESGRHRG